MYSYVNVGLFYIFVYVMGNAVRVCGARRDDAMGRTPSSM